MFQEVNLRLLVLRLRLPFPVSRLMSSSVFSFLHRCLDMIVFWNLITVRLVWERTQKKYDIKICFKFSFFCRHISCVVTDDRLNHSNLILNLFYLISVFFIADFFLFQSQKVHRSSAMLDHPLGPSELHN